MSNFDVLIGIGESTIDVAIAALYKNPTSHDAYFKGTHKQDIEGKGNVTLTYDVLAAPTFTLAPPTDQEWAAAIKKYDKVAKPTDNCIQVEFSSVTLTESIGVGDPVKVTGEFKVYITVTVSNNALAPDPVAIWLDKSKFSEMDQWFIEEMLVPLTLKMAGQFIGTISLPALPSYDGISFNHLAIAVFRQKLLVAATMTTTEDPVSFEGFSVPHKDYFALVNPRLMNAVMAQQITDMKLNGKKFSGSKQEGSDLWGWVKGNYTATLNNVTATANRNDPTKISLSVKTDISASGSFGGIGPTALCPIGTALNAF